MKLFHVSEGAAIEMAARTVTRERDLQELVEANMESMLGVRFLASEYSTGPGFYAGRIDTLGVDENGGPVVVEFKRGIDPGVVSQGLYYLAWLVDHKAEFQHLVRDRLGGAAAAQVLWSAPRLICVAGGYSRYDVHAIREHRRAIDLVRYRYFGSSLVALETVASTGGQAATRPAPPRGQGLARPTVGGRGGAVDTVKAALDEVLAGLGDDVTQIERKQYRAYRRLRNFACVGSTQQRQVVVYVKADPREVDLEPGFTRDVSRIGHHGTGDLEVRLRSERDLERAEPLFRLGYAAA